MYKAAWEVARRVFADVRTWGGIVSSLLGVLSDWFERSLLFPSWVWWLLAVICLFATAWRAQWELMKAEDKSRKPRPEVTLEALVQRLSSSGDDLAGEGAKRKHQALITIRQKAALGLLSVWGRDGANQSVLDHYPLQPIPATHWTNAHVDYMQYIQNARCATQNAQLPGAPTHYADLHFDNVEVEATFPFAKQPKFVLRSPLVRLKGKS
jgi:hypothetical protein